MSLSPEFFQSHREDRQKWLDRGYLAFYEVLERRKLTIEDLERNGVFIQKESLRTSDLLQSEPHPKLKKLFRFTRFQNILLHPKHLQEIERIFDRLDGVLPTGTLPSGMAREERSHRDREPPDH